MNSILVGFALAAVAFAADPFVGTWNVNPAKSSNTDPSADWSQIAGYKLIYETISPSSYKITNLRPAQHDNRTMLARMDGKDYSNDSDGRDYEKDSTLPAGTGVYTIAWQRIDERHHLLIFRKDRKEYSRRDVSISADGKLLTMRQWGLGRRDGKPFDYTLAFDKE
jgi:hypothetical protein